MKTIVKMVSINDGNPKEMQNGQRMWVATFPRMEAVTAAFLEHGYTLINCCQHLDPTTQEEGNFTFYLGGYDMLFKKDVADDAEDDSDAILQGVLAEILEE